MQTVLSPVVSPVITLGEVVDRLGQLRAEIADLEVIADQLKQNLSDSGETKVIGKLYKAAVIYSPGRISTDWKTIAEHFAPSRQLITAHTHQGAAFVSVRISSR
jgi:hypothetical protein